MRGGEKRKAEKKSRFCPYCEEEITESPFPYCQTCGVSVFYCPKCKQPVSRDKRTCPHCGAEIKG